MTSDLVTYLRALAEKHPWTVRSAARMRQPLDGADAQALEGALCSTERERDEARAEVERLRAEVEKLRAALMEISQYETNAPAGFEWDIVVEELIEIARKALEVKP